MKSRCAYVAIIGRPNVGKSTLLNHCIGQKLSITSRKPQTTRYQIQGVLTVENVQLVFVDTPGWQFRPAKRLNRIMNKEIDTALYDVDHIVMVADATRWTKEDDSVAAIAARAGKPTILVLNKHDLLKSKSDLLPLINELTGKFTFTDVIPTNALKGDNLDLLIDLLTKGAPEREHVFAEDEITNRSSRFLVAEILREKLIRGLGDELPYAVSVIVDKFTVEKAKTSIDATIWIEREGQKGIVIGKQGDRLKTIATAARKDMEKLLDTKVFLQTWVKLKSNWSDDSGALSELDLTL